VVDTVRRWISVRRASADGRACRDYIVSDDRGLELLSARAFNWDRGIIVRREERELVRLTRHRSFPFTGKVRVSNAKGEHIGTIRRNGELRDSTGAELGRFRDARTFRARAREAALVGALDALFGGDGSTSELSGPNGYVLTNGDRVVGELVRAVPPFAAESDEAIVPAWVGRHRIARRLVERLLRRTAAWRFDRAEPDDGDAALVAIAGAIFMIELANLA
jgi:hypothetical protein